MTIPLFTFSVMTPFIFNKSCGEGRLLKKVSIYMQHMKTRLVKLVNPVSYWFRDHDFWISRLILPTGTKSIRSIFLFSGVGQGRGRSFLFRSQNHDFWTRRTDFSLGTNFQFDWITFQFWGVGRGRGRSFCHQNWLPIEGIGLTFISHCFSLFFLCFLLSCQIVYCGCQKGLIMAPVSTTQRNDMIGYKFMTNDLSLK